MRRNVPILIVLLGALVQIRCASGPAPIVVRVTSNPSDSLARLRCPNIPQFAEQQAQTPARFHIPADFVRCEVDVSKDNRQSQVLPITRDQIRGGGQPSVTSSDRITLQPGASPFSLLGALISRWFRNIGAALNERVNAEISPEIHIHADLTASSSFSIYRSLNGGASWIAARVGPPPSKRINAFTLDEATSYAGTDDGLFVSPDRGETWSRIATGPAHRIQSLLIVDKTVYAGTENGLYSSRDRGRTWEPRSRGLSDLNIRSLATNGARIFAGTNNAGVFALNSTGTWQKFGEGLPEHAQIFDLAATSSHVYAALYGKGLYRNDSGHAWEKVGEVKPLEILVHNDVIVAGHNPGGIQHSADNGVTWRQSAGFIGSAPIWVLGDAGPIMFGGTTPGAIARSVDSGVTWEQTALGIPADAAVVAVTGNRSVTLAAVIVQEN